MNDVRIIKRYQNRKLYDTHQSCYVTLEEIAQIIREGHEIQVIDNKTKNDITYTTQIQLLFDQEKKSTKAGDTELLKRVIRSTEGTFTGYIRGLEGIEAPVVEEKPANEEFKPFMNNNEFSTTTTTTTVETSNTLN
ncbi:MAG: regulator for granula-associated protein [Halobacteriovoraceae bacterium]|jgi:polyhydroxyalkanoate synthesis repressor PhaR|nr:regulator for granula-associated protein [Halobacteriovoraceae bacterium]MBC98676.1 regulator for granula-associated protein [Halobacteriovoraceae bacterium]|tara:strand:- start:2044 stop:2451 length:408 start_codon:yes stop_codon:yes gene_type:complete